MSDQFHFPLQKVLDWRRTQLEIEEAKFRQASEAVAAVDRARAEVQATAAQAELEVRRWDGVAGRDLHALAGYRLHARAQDQALAAKRVECSRQAAAQQSVMLEARRRSRLLERLRERRLAEWKAAQTRELDALASESYIAQWRPPAAGGRARRARL
jgi:hypothetical protein